MFLPYITPERTPIMKKDTFSGIVNLRSGNNRNNAARSILEGVAFCVYDAWRCVQEILFLEEPEITMLGGVSKNPIVRDSLLNLMNAKIKFLSENLDPSSFGAAVMAGKIEGKFDKIEDIIEKMVVETANARQKSEYLEKYEHFLNVRKKLLNV
jgi:sugar (pentulose or hexulose) kinase